MADEQKNKTLDDEYQFPQDEYVSSESEGHVHLDEDALNPAIAEASTSQKLSAGARVVKKLHELPPLKNKRVIIVVVVVIIVVIFFRFLRTDTPKPQQPTPTAAPVEQVVTSQSTSSNLMNTLGSMSDQDARTQSQIQTLQSQLSDLQRSMSQTQATQQSLQKSVSDLTTEMQAMSAQLNKVPVKGPRQGPGMVYHLRAVLPDRAWITSSTGKTLTVTVGNHIPQYGTVRVIDAQRGIIETSSGRKIMYGANDY